MKYAQINRKTSQMIGSPHKLPERFVTPSGATISFFNKLPSQALAGLDWLPVIYESLPGPETHSHSLIPEIVDEQFIYRAIPRDLEILRSNALMTINETANHVIRIYVPVESGQSYTEILKQDEACKYLKTDKPTLANYPVIKEISSATGKLPREIAEIIMEEAMAWTLKISEVEACRAKGLMECGNAKTHEEIIECRNTVLSALELI